jgi:hypothetical protein
MKKLTFLWTDSTPVKGPYTLARLRGLWGEGKINAGSHLFLTERDDETNKVNCLNLTAEDIRHELETGAE